MKQALHIFKKDVRYLRWEVGMLLALLCIFVALSKHFQQLTVSALLLACASAFLCARLVQAEAIPGDRQFWTTRPYDWRSLLGAKLIFLVVMISLPLLLADSLILGTHGFSIGEHLPDLLWSACLTTVGMLLGFCAFAALTKGLVDWILGAIAVTALAWLLTALSPAQDVWNRIGAGWLREYGFLAIIVVTSAAVLLTQYRRHKTALSIGVMALGLACSALFLSYLPLGWVFSLETHFSKPKIDISKVQIGLRAPAERVRTPIDPRQEMVALVLPLDVSGVEPGQNLVSDGVGMAIGDGPTVWGQGGNKFHLTEGPDGYQISFLMNRALFERTKNSGAHVQVTLYLTLSGDPVSSMIQFGSARKYIPGVGVCRYSATPEFGMVSCESALRAPARFLDVKFGGSRWGQLEGFPSYSPFPGDSSLFPVALSAQRASSEFAPATLTTREPLAHFRRDLDLPGGELEKYELTPRFF